MLTGGKNVIPHAVRDVADAAAAFSARIGPDRHFDSQEKVEEALAECCSPQNVTVIGMTGSGKSSTLDALAGERFCSRVSSEATLVRWQYRPHPAPHTHEWVLDLFYPSDALLNLEFWDTIGLEQEDAPRKLKHIVPKSDAILVVISASDGNHSALWDYLQTLEERLHSRMVLVITHAELLSFERLQSLKEELRSTSRERLGVQLPLYPVTTAGEHAGEGVEALTACVQEVLKRSPLTDKRVERLLLATDSLLEEQGKVLDELSRLSKMDSGFLTSIDREIDRIQLQMEDEMPARLKAYAQYVQDCVPRLGKKSARQMGRFLSIRRTMILHKLPPVIDEWFYELVKSGIEERHAYYNKEFLNICQTHWNHVRPRVKEQWDCDIGDFRKAPDGSGSVQREAGTFHLHAPEGLRHQAVPQQAFSGSGGCDEDGNQADAPSGDSGSPAGLFRRARSRVRLRGRGPGRLGGRQPGAGLDAVPPVPPDCGRSGGNAHCRGMRVAHPPV